MPHNKKLGTAEKIEIIRDQLAGKYSIEEAAQRAGVSRSTIQGWKMVYEAEGVEGFIRQRNRAYGAAEKRQP